VCPLPKRFFDPVDSIPAKIDSFDDCRWMLPDASRMLENGKPHSLIWMQPVEAEFLWECVKKRPRGTAIVEIGRCEGGSTILMGAAKNPEDALISIDIDPVDDDQCLEMIDHFGIENIQLRIGDSGRCDTSGVDGVGLLLIDGDHSYNGIVRDFENWFPLVVPGGMILMHDVNRFGAGQGPWKFYSECVHMEKIEPIEIKQTLALLRKKPTRRPG